MQVQQYFLNNPGNNSLPAASLPDTYPVRLSMSGLFSLSDILYWFAEEEGLLGADLRKRTLKETDFLSLNFCLLLFNPWRLVFLAEL